MTIKECIDIVDNIKPNQYTIKEKVMWLSFIEAIIINEVLKTHEGYDGRYDMFEGYSEDKISQTLIVSAPYDRLYTAYLKMKIDEENGETTRYNNSAALYNNYMAEYKKYYNKTHMPIDVTKKSKAILPKIPSSSGLSEAEYENLKRDMTFILTEFFSNTLSDDKVAEVVNEFVQNNIQLLKGKNGHTPIRGVDYFNETDKEEIKNYIDSIVNETLKKVNDIVNKSLTRTIILNLRASEWLEDDGRYYQIISIPNITPYSKVDLQPTAEQLAIFREKDITFVTENENRIVTVFCIGQKPANDYMMQATITEVEKNG